MKDLDRLTSIETQARRDSWQAVRNLVRGYLKKSGGRFSFGGVKHEYAAVRRVFDKGSREIREALNELSTISEDGPVAGDFTTSPQGPLPVEEEGKPVPLRRRTKKANPL